MRGNREQLAKRIRPTLEEPDEVWLALYAVHDGRRDRPEVRTHYVKVWDDEGSFSVGVEDRAGNVLWTWFQTDWEGLNQRRRGILVYAAEQFTPSAIGVAAGCATTDCRHAGPDPSRHGASRPARRAS